MWLKRIVPMLMVVAVVAIPAAAGAVGGFTGPVFGLSTADNGDLLVADAGAGIASTDGAAVLGTIPLPGVTSTSDAGGGLLWATTGAGADPEMDTGQGLWLVDNGVPAQVANLYLYESTNNPDGNVPFDSNPYDVVALGADSALVVDAGGNDLLRFDDAGVGETLAIFPDEVVSTENIMSLAGCPESGIPGFCGLPDMMPAQAVPTSVAVGDDGWYYVGELKGFPGPTGESNIWKVAPTASAAACGASADCVKVFDGGFTSIIDLTFHNGMLFVAELDEQSWAAVEIFQGGAGGTISACDVTALECQVVRSGIPMLTGITFDGNGTLWATRNTLIPGQAEVFPINLPTEGMGLFDAAQGTWTLPAVAPPEVFDFLANGAPFYFGNPGDLPMVGDWDCDGIDTPGLYRQSDGFVYLRNSNTQGIADIQFFFGNPGDVPIAGDFDGDGCDTVSVYRPSTSQVFVINELGEDGGGLGAAESSFVFGNPGDVPYVGDFDGDGIDTVGLHRASTGFVYYRDTLTTGNADNSFYWGDPGDVVFAGDWDSDGVDTPGLYRSSNSTFYWRNANTAGPADGTAAVTPTGTPVPVAGHFD